MNETIINNLKNKKLTKNILMNSASVGTGAVLSETTGDYRNLLIALAVALLSELIKYLKAKRNENSNIENPKVEPWAKTIASLFRKNNDKINRK